MQYPHQIEIIPLTTPPTAAVRVPGSKSITNRALVLAALTVTEDQTIVLENVLQSEDTEVMAEGLSRLGTRVVPDWATHTIDLAVSTGATTVLGDINVVNSGTSMRFLTAMVSLQHGRFRLDGIARMRERPIQDLLDALAQLGVNTICENGNGCPPVIIDANGLRGGAVRIKGESSSQFLSGLLMAAPFAESDLTIEVDGPLVSVPYVEMTVTMMRQFGLHVTNDHCSRFHVPAPQHPVPLTRYVIEPDASAASYFFAAAAITGGQIGVTGLPTPSLQGDVRFVDLLQQMGCRIERGPDTITVHGSALHGIDVDMNDISDTVMTLGAVACFAAGPTTIRNVGHIRHKETDRLAALATELRRLGAAVEECADGLTITPGPLRDATVQTYNDHRMAMSLALVGLKIPGVVIDNPGCVAKTYPRFFEDLERLRG
ncbi:MAG TPA: 3-phosphoshikimate 1-carboxyvinyltransferase [Gemmataceae bacterium]|nr:3-phosphoshikimate 1-carboxyvinyltransferase [Gemmataceae bacterium]